MKPPRNRFTPWLGVFETLRVEQGRVQFADEHWKSLRTAAKALGLKVSGDLRKASAELAKKSGRLRWVVDVETTYAFFSEEKRTVKPAFTLALAPQRLGSQNWDARYKTLSYLTHWQARHSVKTDEALLVNENGIIASGAMTNLFWVKDGALFTPGTQVGCRAGVVRQWVLVRAKVREGAFPLSDLAHADEIFLTNSWIGIRPVSQWNGKKLKTGAVTKKVMAAWEKGTW